MTWNATCPGCGGKLFVCTVNSTSDVHVNCADPECGTYIGKMPSAEVLCAPVPEPH